MKLRAAALAVVAIGCVAASPAASRPAACCTVKGKVVGAPTRGSRIAFAEAIPLETGVSSSVQLRRGLAYSLPVPPRPAVVSATVIDFGTQKIYSGRTKPFVTRKTIRKNVTVRATGAFRTLASAAGPAGSASPDLTFEVRGATLTFPDGHTGRVTDWISNLAADAKLPCTAKQTAEHDPRFVEARQIEKTLQDKGLTSTHMDFSKVIHATHSLSASVTVGPESGGGFEASADFTLVDASSGQSLGTTSVKGRYASLEEFEQAMKQALADLLSRACRFQLDFETTLSFTEDSTWTQDQDTVHETMAEGVHVRVQSLQIQAGGPSSAPLQVLDHSVTYERHSVSQDGHRIDCTGHLSASSPTSPLTVYRLQISGGDPPAIVLELSFGAFPASMEGQCVDTLPDAQPVTVPFGPSPTYQAYGNGLFYLHQSELAPGDDQPTYDVKNWTYLGGSVFARKTYSQSMSMPLLLPAGPGTITETTTFELRRA